MKLIFLGIFGISVLCNAQEGLPFSGTDSSKQFIQIDATIDPAFSAAETEFLEEAVGLLQSRFIANRVQDCSLANRRRTNVAPGYWQETNWSKAKGAREETLGFQLAYFQRNPTGNPLKLEIKAFHDRQGPFASAPGSVVKTMSDGNFVKEVKGDFFVRVNRWHLLSNADEGKSVSFWAATLAHEMLHNMGHDHDTKDYEGNEIIAFDKCVETNGSLETESGSGTSEKITRNRKTGKVITRKPDICEKKAK